MTSETAYSAFDGSNLREYQAPELIQQTTASRMPSTYLCRGFKWHRPAIRMYVMMNDLERCSPDWIIGWDTSEQLLKALYKDYPLIPGPLGDNEGKELEDETATRTPKEQDFVLRHQWSAIKLLEAYDDKDTTRHCLPYAFVADHVIRVELNVDVTGEINKFTKKVQQERAWFEKLCGKMQPEESVQWYIVVVADEVREHYPLDPDGKGETEYIQEEAEAQAERDAQEQEQAVKEGSSTP